MGTATLPSAALDLDLIPPNNSVSIEGQRTSASALEKHDLPEAAAGEKLFPRQPSRIVRSEEDRQRSDITDSTGAA